MIDEVHVRVVLHGKRSRIAISSSGMVLGGIPAAEPSRRREPARRSRNMHNWMHNPSHELHLARDQATSQHETKRQANLKKHGVDFATAERVFAGPTFTFEDDRERYGERRWVTLGLSGRTVMVIVHTETEDEIRVISMREGDNDEQLLFFTNLRQS